MINMKKFIDFRSDTVTRPTKEMEEAMFSARVGDDVFGEDPTVNALEAKLAAMFGMEAAMFTPSGVMANQIAIKVHTQPGDEVVCDKLAHIYHYEGGGVAFNSGASVRLLEGDYGRFTAEQVRANINNPDDVHHPLTRLVVVENTCNKGGGSIWDIREIQKIRQVVTEKQLKFHLDGARIFNALAETGEHPADYGALFDSVSICLSKGLGAPVGSVLMGDTDFIYRARRVRKVMGGAMRQIGYLAAAGIYALDNHLDRLKKDHHRAKILARHLEQQPYVEKVIAPQTNIVIFHLSQGLNELDFLNKLKEAGILAVPFGRGVIRMVTHLDISETDLEAALKVLSALK